MKEHSLAKIPSNVFFLFKNYHSQYDFFFILFSSNPEQISTDGMITSPDIFYILCYLEDFWGKES